MIVKNNNSNIEIKVNIIKKCLNNCSELSFSELSKIKDEPGIYFIYSKSSHQLLKIGESNTLKTRLKQNYSLSKINSCGFKDKIDDSILPGYKTEYDKYKANKDVNKKCLQKANQMFVVNFYFKFIYLVGEVDKTKMRLIEEAITLSLYSTIKNINRRVG